MKKILHVSYNMGIGGAERALFQLIRGQLSSGLSPSLVLLDRSAFYAEKVAALGVSVYELNQKSAFDFSITKPFVQIASEYDCVHFHCQTPTLMYAIGRSMVTAAAYTHRGGEIRANGKRRLMHYITGKLIARYINAVSGNTRHALNCGKREYRLPHSETIVTYNGIDFSLLAPIRTRAEVLKTFGESEQPSVWRIGTTANLRELKRIDLLIRAIAELNNENIHCYIIGDGPAKSDLQKLTNSLGVSDRIKFIEKQEHVGDFLQIFDAFALLSDQAESFGNSVVEAMGLGIPTLVMADGGGMIEHFPEGYRPHPKNLIELTQRIKYLIKNQDAAMTEAKKCQDYAVKKYTIENMVNSCNELYKIANENYQTKVARV